MIQSRGRLIGAFVCLIAVLTAIPSVRAQSLPDRQTAEAAATASLAQSQVELEQLAASLPVTLDTGGGLTPLTIDPYAAKDPLEVWNDWRMEAKRDREPALLVIAAHKMWAYLHGVSEGEQVASLASQPAALAASPWTSESLGAVVNFAPAAPVPGEDAEVFVSVDPNNPLHIVASNNHRLLGDATCTSTLTTSGVTLNSNGGQELYWSTDGGANWSRQCAPWDSGSAFTLTTANGTSPFTFQSSDPSVTWDTSGNAYVFTLPWWQDASGNRSGNSVNVVKWTASTNTWSAISTPETHVNCTSNTCETMDKTEAAIDTTSGQTFSHTNRAYFFWTRIFLQGAQFRYRVRIARADPPYTAWTIIDFAPGGVVEQGTSLTRLASRVVVGADGTAYVAWDRNLTTGSTLMISKSTDGGLTWSAGVPMGSTATLTDFAANTKIAAQDTRGIALLPQLSVDNAPTSPFKGNLYSAHTDFHTGVTSGNDVDVIVRRSIDGGTTWTTAATFAGVASGTSQFEPATAVDPSTGLVTVTWYDTSIDPSLNRKVQVYAAQSSDGGTTWSAQQLVTDNGANFTNHVNFLDENSTDMPNVTTLHHYQYGEYMGVSSSGGQLWMAWTDSRSWVTGTPSDTEYEDIGMGTACTPPATPTANNNGPICAGATLLLSTPTVAGATYAWTGPNGFTSSTQNPSIPSATTAATGTYSVTVTVGGCASSPGTTSATVIATGSSCTDSNACTTGDVCVAGGTCSGAAVTCTALDQCHAAGTCNPATGLCSNPNAPNGTSCNDANACTTGDACASGVCQPGTAVVCNDNNVCTTDTCDPASGCVFTNNTNPCSDGNACTTGDTCSGGSCQPGTGTLSCDDSNPCTDDTCAPATGCVFTNNTAPCSDGNACTTGDTCSGGSCQPGTGTLSCNDNNPCTDDTCAPATGCVFTNNTSPCSDGNACTTGDTCGGGTCNPGAAVVCNDSNVCTTDTCNPATGCVYTNNTNPCDDGNACTTGDTCGGGICNAGTPTVCNDNNVCTDDTCNPATGCVYTNNTSACDDGNACTTGDTCAGGICNPGTATVCNDNNPCTDDSCNPATGCVYTNNTSSCDDGNACTTSDTCSGGVCGGTTVLCNDNNVCTTDSCNPATGCVYTKNTIACDDGDACTSGDTCGGGRCNPGTPVVCNDNNACTTDSCNPATGCVYTNNTNPCDDGNACTTGDACGGGTCNPGTAVVCNDNNVCTTDTCNPANGCVYTNNTNPCDDGNACTTGDTCGGGTCNPGSPTVCNDNNVCTTDTCNPATGCVYSNNSNPCEDGNACTSGDTCSLGTCHAGTGAVDCDDSNPCTDDSCNPATGCVHTNNTNPCSDGNACTTGDTCGGGICQPGAPIFCNDSNICTTDSCDPATGCVFTNNTRSCNDGNACTTHDTCGGGLCHPGPALVCDDSNACTNDTCNPSTGCVFLNNTSACDDGNPCTVGDACSNGSCQGGTTITAPAETQNVKPSSDKSTFTWSATALATRYDVVRGGTASFPVGPGGGDEVCFDNLAGTTLVDAAVPSAGGGFWYLSRGENACGNGTYGTQSNGTPRTSTTCP